MKKPAGPIYVDAAGFFATLKLENLLIYSAVLSYSFAANYLISLVGAAGFELATPCTPCRDATSGKPRQHCVLATHLLIYSISFLQLFPYGGMCSTF